MTGAFRMRLVRPTFVVLAVSLAADVARAAHQTETVTPPIVAQALPYQIQLRRVDLGDAQLPTLHSFAAGMYDGKWIMLAGRSNGIHGFENSGKVNFPPQFQNRDVWVVDPASGQSWQRSLEVGAGLAGDVVAALTSTNNQFMQVGDRLYMTGGYGQTAAGGLDTHATLSAIDLPGIVDWVARGAGQASDHIRTVTDELFRVTGGVMYEMDGRAHLIFGQAFRGGYVPNRNGDYTQQVRSFTIVDDGTTLGFADVALSEPRPEYRRRDLNVYPVVHSGENGALDVGLTALSGVFTESFGAWTVPVEVDERGILSMADAEAADTFKQAMNNYHSAKLGLFSEATGEMHELLFGGITLQEYDSATGQFVQDDALPWTNQITSVVRSETGDYRQHLISEFPAITDQDGQRLRFGANAEFFPAPGVATYENGVIKLDELTGGTVIGHIFGGIFANAPHVRGVPDATSGASNILFEVLLNAAPPTGDTNDDGSVDIDDLNAVRNYFGATGMVDGSLAGDTFPWDGVVNIEDLNNVRNNFGAMQSQAAPEPTTLLLATVGATLISAGGRRRRRAAGLPDACGLLE